MRCLEKMSCSDGWKQHHLLAPNFCHHSYFRHVRWNFTLSRGKLYNIEQIFLLLMLFPCVYGRWDWKRWGANTPETSLFYPCSSSSSVVGCVFHLKQDDVARQNIRRRCSKAFKCVGCLKNSLHFTMNKSQTVGNKRGMSLLFEGEHREMLCRTMSPHVTLKVV